jgi:hypothetical protein
MEIMKKDLNTISGIPVDMKKLWDKFGDLHPDWEDEDYMCRKHIGYFPELPVVQFMEGATVLFVTTEQLEELEAYSDDRIEFFYEEWSRSRSDEPYRRSLLVTEDDIDEIFVYNQDGECSIIYQ